MNKLFLFDIEGTTTDINFVHRILFPYSSDKMNDFVLLNHQNPEVAAALGKAQDTIWEEEKKSFDLEYVIQTLLEWIKKDRKHPALKEIQGLIWESGYKHGDFKGHLYDDVLPFFKSIKTESNVIGIYSSGSVHAQKLLFAHTEFGDLTDFISFFFDTKIGHKRERNSYERIAAETRFPPSEIYFFSDIKEELDAAHAAGFQCFQLNRYPIEKSKYAMIGRFDQFKMGN